ncbi:unnamed protein product [Echinostoma caproni]|uniref:Ig-like domain-containing protein n=1 Tax=Echinostoma caproni TaxID=27848 RepID=A0A183AG37_9TREM|nr:unnamed protein product [Echinostoma caproni]
MPSNYQATQNVPAIGLLSTLSLLQTESTIQKSARGPSSKPLTKPTDDDGVKQNLVTGARASKLAKYETLGFRIHNTAAGSSNSGAETRLILRPQTAPSDLYPVYRFYSPVARAYLTASEEDRLITASIKNPFSALIEWEWISVPTYSGTYMRHVHSQRYLCFNKNGRPILLKNAYFPRCLLRINAFVNVSSKFHNSISRDRIMPGTTLNLRGTRTVPKSHKSVSNSLSHSITVNVTEHKHGLNHNSTGLISGKSHSGSITRVKQISREVPRIGPVPVPQLVWIGTAAHLPPWRVQFCASGLPFTQLKPGHGRCPFLHLPRLSEVFILQPKISARCMSACRIPEGVRTKNVTHGGVEKCPKECLQEGVSHLMGSGKVSRVNFTGISTPH